MPQVFSYTHLSNGQRIFLGELRINSDERDDEGYQHFDVYDDEYLENRLGSLGIKMSGEVYSVWGFAAESDVRKSLSEIMRLAFPFLKLPISPDQYTSMNSTGYFPLVQLFSDGKIAYDEANRVVHLPAGSSPEDFFKSTVFSGKLNEDNVRKVVLIHGYLEGLNDDSGDFRFLSIEITRPIWPINSVRVTKAFRSLVDDGLLEPYSGNTSSGFPSFTRIPSHARRAIENIEEADEDNVQQVAVDDKPSSASTPYISMVIANKVTAAANTKGYNTAKLESIISELNDAVERSKAQSSHALIRALLDHIAPLFGQKNFGQVANNHKWSQTDKKRIQQLDTLFRFDADESLHAPITKRDTSADMHSIGLIRRTVNVVLEEASN